ncbi:uncharacterized protein LOC110443859 [Mizuhopecten yessoensis]|uniref:Laminin G domain-containing protein n=1 Tax=Mizuhopecten yessoensis TaxID=6573 RepID=A0A210PDU0_MIZYE|nr:uncharacterized protein LOC110443859 [Mizuhopecten yessoensis]XP_021343968.1 uncharacterized protein LOC110443859 [Mizuhopecten yessoensis]XP_021343969.1 uncharacterized protein LOC110443859 [Mizuhopecten yessoensis]XP_021343970.1 uncharacterized protein LOC110443859 [Mizuhopecten yessoensis]OWF34665.1 hypothetical protein KP79_PYT11434 [Mizuhopecten yessoensis]
MANRLTLIGMGVLLLTMAVYFTSGAPATHTMQSTSVIRHPRAVGASPQNSIPVVTTSTSTTPSLPQDAPETTKKSTTVRVTRSTLRPTSTFDPGCMHRPHPTNPRLFEIARTPNHFEGEYQSCASTLVWNQANCACDWPTVVSLKDLMCGEYRKHPDSKRPWMYQRLVNREWIDYSCSVFIRGLFSEQTCKCNYGPSIESQTTIQIPKTDPVPKQISKCVVVANITMDIRVKDDSGGHLTLSRNSHIRITNRINGSKGGSALIRRSPIEVESFYANDLTDTVRFAFNFKIHRFSINSRRHMVLVSNGCWSTSTSMRYKIRPSVEIRFRPFDQTFGISFETIGNRVIKNIRGNRDRNGWYKVVIYLQDNTLKLLVNNKTVFTRTGMIGALRKRDCKLTIAGSPYQAMDHFDGYFDEFLSVKQCRCDCMNSPSKNLPN